MSAKLDHLRRVKKLYKIIMRLHKGLPEELQVLGTNYARDEFKRHRNCQPNEAEIFLNEWTNYALTLSQQLKPLEATKNKTLGKYMGPKLIENMTDDQVEQLYELAQAAMKKEPEENVK